MDKIDYLFSFQLNSYSAIKDENFLKLNNCIFGDNDFKLDLQESFLLNSILNYSLIDCQYFDYCKFLNPKYADFLNKRQKLPTSKNLPIGFCFLTNKKLLEIIRKKDERVVTKVLGLLQQLNFIKCFYCSNTKFLSVSTNRIIIPNVNLINTKKQDNYFNDLESIKLFGIRYFLYSKK